MDQHPTFVIIPTQVESWISGVSHVEMSGDQIVSLTYEDHSQISARLEFVSHALQSNFFALVRSVQNVARANGQRLDLARLA